MLLYKPSDLHKILNDIKAKPKKSFSQNFLIDGNIVNKFVDTLNVSSYDIIVEIGPGPGVLTQKLLEKGAKVIAIEKDAVLAKNLEKLNNGKLEIYNEDFLEFDLEKVLKDKKAKVIASLPYSITTPIIIKLLENSKLFTDISIMMQKEVAHRITAKPNSKIYGSITVFINYYSDPEYCFKVSRNCFYPAPKVDSAIVKLSIKSLDRLENPALFHKMVRTAFNQRRKQLISSLKSLCDKNMLIKALEELEIKTTVRPEQLDLNQFLSLFKKLFNGK